jgi:hypothetical protein
MRSVAGILMALLFTCAAHGEGWTMDKLVGLAPEFDGPSCYTAAFLAKGYVDTVSFVGTKELEFFLDRFCEEKFGSPEVGDFLTLTAREFADARPHVDHIATYLGNGEVFEKEGSLGKFKPYMKQDPYFLRRPMRESPWFKNYEGDGLVLKVYRCQDAKIVRAQTAKCEERVNAFGMADLRRDFERVLLTKPAKFDPSPASVSTIRKLSQELGDIPESDPCYDYVIAMGDMLKGTFMNMRIKQMESLSDDWKAARADLERVLKSRFGIL